MNVELDDAKRAIVNLSIVTHILKPEVVGPMSAAAGDDALLPPKFEAAPALGRAPRTCCATTSTC